ncbi:MAG TPA: hypothetical protein VGO73_08785 [Pyrinomonadaceae bacterium]|jgi:hypothetical protein|nr:hypothetical protein [Pyrinomonadaceae bacterium]
MRKYFVLALAVLGLAIAAGVQSASGQIETQMKVNIPFPFSVENTTLPPGNYTITRVDKSDPTILELRSDDGKTAVIFKGISAQSTSTPDKSVLVFKKYGDQEILSQIFEQGNPNGIELPKSRPEERAGKGGAKPVKHVIELAIVPGKR